MIEKGNYMNKTNCFGLLTFYKEKNYGAALQAFSLQKKIEELGYKSEFINWHDSLNKVTIKDSTIQKAARLLKTYGINYNKYLFVHGASIQVGNQFDQFVNNHLAISQKAFYDSDDLCSVADSYNGFIAGSDMVWTDIGQDLNTYFMQFAPKGKRGSYAASLTGTSGLSEVEKIKYAQWIEGIEYLSVREEEGIRFVENICNRQATLTVDPTLLHTKEEWIRLLSISQHTTKRPYILCYMFGGVPSGLHRRIKELAKRKNMDIRYIPMSSNEFYYEKVYSDTAAYGPKEFVELFLNAQFVITNSYHGFLFSLISGIPFVIIQREKGSKWKNNEERISSLLRLIGEEKRLVESAEKLDESLLSVDYTYINTVLTGLRNESTSYLNNMLACMSANRVEESSKELTIESISRKECVECKNCLLKCPVKAISMNEDAEGFIKPVIDKEKCIGCSQCIKVCPAVKAVDINAPIKTMFGFSSYPEQKLSASGGAFYHIARKMIENYDAYVYGATFDNANQVYHIEIHDIKELNKLQGSKYVKSNFERVFDNVKEKLENNNWVLFSGTPCQVASLNCFLGREYEKLITIDLVCHGVPSVMLWRSYLDYLSGENHVSNISFRNKDSESSTRSAFELKAIVAGKHIRIPSYKSPYYKLYQENKTFRYSCYYCKFARQERCGDFTIGDCDSWRIQKEFHPEKAKSIILINTKKAINISTALLKSFEYEDLDYKLEYSVNTPLSRPSEKPIERETIYSKIAQKGWDSYLVKEGIVVNLYRVLKRFLRNER